MKLRGLTVSNFLSVGSNPVRIPINNAITTIVGPNGSGKTSVFRAIAFASDIFNNRALRNNFEEYVKPYYHRGNTRDPIEVEVELELDDEEIEALIDFLVCSCLHNISQHHEDKQRDLEKQVIVKYGRQIFKELFRQVALVAKVYRKRDYPTISAIKISGNNKSYYIHQYGSLTNSATRPKTQRMFSLVDVLLSDLNERHAAEVKDYLESKTDTLFDLYHPKGIFDAISQKLDVNEPTHIDIQGYSFRDTESRVENLLNIDDLHEIHNLTHFLSSRGFEEDSANIFNVFGTIYDSSIARIANTRCLPVGIYLENGLPKSYNAREFTGNDLPALLFELKNSIDSDQRESYSAITSEFEKMTGYQFEIFLRDKEISRTEYESSLVSPSEVAGSTIGQIPVTRSDIKLYGIKEQDKAITLHELTICFIKDKMVIPLELAASGLFEILYILTLLVGARSQVILLDEPALNLHPNMQRRILDIVKKTSIMQNKNQVVLITHSPYMVDVGNPENIWRFSLDNDDSTKVISLGGTLENFDHDDRKQLQNYLTSVEVRSLLFSRGMVLTEGPSDGIVLHLADSYLSSIGKGANLEEKEWIITDVGGKDSFRMFLALAKQLGISYAVVIDFDALMKCERIIRYGNTEIRTSSILNTLYQTGMLREDEINWLKKTHDEGNISFLNDEPSNGQWYDSEKTIENLKVLALRNRIFVFTEDLEGALQLPKTSKKRKPLKSVDAILEAIESGKLPSEFYSLFDWLRGLTSKII